MVECLTSVGVLCDVSVTMYVLATVVSTSDLHGVEIFILSMIAVCFLEFLV